MLNIIVLDTCPQRCAQAYCDQDVQTKPLEYLQTLEHAVNKTSRHVNARWAQDEDNRGWLGDLAWYLAIEQRYRFGRASEKLESSLPHLLGLTGYNKEPARFLQLIPERIPGDPVTAFRAWYHRNAASPSWAHRGAPTWWKGPEQLVFNF